MKWLKPKPVPPKPFRVVSFFTEDNEYAEHARRLRNTLERFAIPYDLQPIRSVGPWEHNCAGKA